MLQPPKSQHIHPSLHHQRGLTAKYSPHMHLIGLLFRLPIPYLLWAVLDIWAVLLVMAPEVRSFNAERLPCTV